MCFLGHMVSKKKVMVDPRKVKAVKNWARLMNMIEIYSFVGLASYYRQFIKGFAVIASHLTYLT